MVATTTAPASTLNGFTKTLGQKDFAALGEFFTPTARLRALTPNSTYGMFGRDCVIATYKLWFDESPEIEVLTSETEAVGDRIRVAYRLRAFDIEQELWCIVEQQAYCRLRDGLISDISIVCSGFLPIE